jgi:glutamate-1-semialdehyde 2,1-aminomutase
MGVVPPEPGFLEGLRELCTAHGSLLIFDEVITGFRLAYRGAQGHFSITPDLTVLGKVMGGGFPCAAFGGRSDVMERLAPAGPGRPRVPGRDAEWEPVAVAVGLAALELARDRNPYSELTKTAEELAAGLEEAFERRGIPSTVNRVETMFSVFFTAGPVRTFDDVRAADHERFARFFHHMLDRGVYLPPSGYEMWTLSTTHGPQEIERTLEAASSFPG